MKIFFRYLLMRVLQPFAICLAACAMLWIMTDLYGTMEDFLEHKVNLMLILRFYAWQIPKMLVQVLPAAMLFSTLWTLLSLNRRSELVALQSGGMAPIWMFSPFLLFGLIWVIVLALDLSGPSAWAEVTRERLLKQVKGQGGERNTSFNLPYDDTVNRRIWFFQKLDTASGTANGVELKERDADGRVTDIYIAVSAKWTGEFWRFSGVTKLIYGSNSREQKHYEELDLPDVTTPPRQLSLIVSQPEQLSISQLSQYIDSSTQSPEHLAQYRTEWWYRVLYPLSIFVLMLYALLQGTRTDRRSAATGVIVIIGVFFAYIFLFNFFRGMGEHNRLPPFVSVSMVEVIFGGVALHLLAINNGWYWQLRDFWREWMSAGGEQGEDSRGDA